MPYFITNFTVRSRLLSESAIALYPQITKRDLAFLIPNPKVRSPLLSESAIAFPMLNPKVRSRLLSESAIGSYQAFTRYKLIVI
ncbi:MAG: hypothetical protein P2A85_22085 [Microcoleus anatoxicus]|uniref:hypothetical protein n=1 Tax=Microcoleus anatoxicus TaxID=2705319 RepID=UPI00366FBD6B